VFKTSVLDDFLWGILLLIQKKYLDKVDVKSTEQIFSNCY